jgi:hypothetical protein
MHYLKLPNMDSEVSVFDICQAHAQLESDYNVGGWLHERPSNQRRNESTSSQLSRLQYEGRSRWVDIYTDQDDGNDSGDEDVKDIYIQNVLKLNLPTTAEERAFIAARYNSSFLATFPSWSQSCLHS